MYFWARIWKYYCHISNQRPRISLVAKFGAKTKILNFGPKMPCLGIFGQEFEKKLLSYWKSAPSNLAICKISRKNKNAEIWKQNAWFGYFWARILESYCHVLNQHLRICVIPKFCEETKMLRFGTKNALFEYFWPKMLYLVIFGLEFKKKKLLSYLKSAPLNLCNCKTPWNNENA